MRSVLAFLVSGLFNGWVTPGPSEHGAARLWPDGRGGLTRRKLTG